MVGVRQRHGSNLGSGSPHAACVIRPADTVDVHVHVVDGLQEECAGSGQVGDGRDTITKDAAEGLCTEEHEIKEKSQVVVHFDLIANAKSSEREIEFHVLADVGDMGDIGARLAGTDVAVQKRVPGHEAIGVKGGSPILRQCDGRTDEVFANHV
jgi:hypothetical protein